MKLKNKKTGEIVEDTDILGLLVSAKYDIPIYRSLAELNEEWEDYEEPKYYWYIDDAGVIQIDEVLSSEINMRKSIGNYFESEEEAEKAVEKLKAWKLLKDKGFKFKRWQFVDDRSGIWIKCNLVMGIADELDIVFGGEE